jgi:hypothetical protein
LDEAKGDWDATDSDAAKRWYHAATYEAVIEVEIERGDWDEVIHAATRMREILNGD